MNAQPSNARLLTSRHITLRGDVMVLTLSNPGARNALHPDIYAQAIEVFETIAQDDTIRAVVLTGADDFFCAGGNLNRLLHNRTLDRSVQAESIDLLGSMIEAFIQCEKPLIAAVEGAAAGAGCALALACDMIVAAEGTKFAAAYVKNGLSPDAGLTWFLPQLLPRPVAFEMAVMGEVMTAERLQTLGVVSRVVPPKTALAEAIELAKRLAAGPQNVQSGIKKLLQDASTRGLSEHLFIEGEGFVNALFEHDAHEGMTAFLEKRAPQFK